MKKIIVLAVSIVICVALAVFACLLIESSDEKEVGSLDNNVVDDFVPGLIEIRVTELADDNIKGVVINGGILLSADDEITIEGINNASKDENGQMLEENVNISFILDESDVINENTVTVNSFKIID